MLVSDYLFDTYGIDASHPYWHIYENWIGAEFGTTIKRLGLKSLKIQESLWLVGDKNFMLDASYLEILDTVFFSETLPLVEYNKQVTSVDYTASGVVVNCMDGSTYTADKVLITVPLPILKENSIAFTPALPASKTAAIENIGMGTGMKILLKFSETFWNEDALWFTYYNYAQSGWAPGLPKTYGTNNVITCFIMGEKAEYLSALGEGALDVVLAELDLFYDGAATEKFVESKIIDWIKEPFVKGVYSYPTPGTFESEYVSKRLDLAEPVDCKVFFAGEATSNNHPATVHGALESGARAAAEIIECFSTPIQDVIADANISMYATNGIAYFNINTQTIATAKLALYNTEGKRIQQFYFDKIPAGENVFQFEMKYTSKGVYVLQAVINGKLYEKKIAC